MSRLVTRDFLSATFTGFKGLFDKSLAAAEPLYPKIATAVSYTHLTLPTNREV